MSKKNIAQIFKNSDGNFCCRINIAKALKYLVLGSLFNGIYGMQQPVTPEQSKMKDQITIMPIDAKILTEDLAFESALKEVYDDAFNAIYGEGNWKDMFEYYINQYKESQEMILVVAVKDDYLTGWALFKHDEHTAVLELICIDPHFWRHGIGKKLVFSIRDFLPNINHIAVVTRKINRISPHFYESLGFKKTDFTLAEYSDFSGQLQGYEWAA